MKRFLFLLMASCTLPLLFSVAAEAQLYEFKQANSRDWADSSGQSEFRARLVSCDRKAGNVVLKTHDETPVEVSIRDLSINDRRYLDRQCKIVDRAAKRVATANRKVVKEITKPVRVSDSPLTLNTKRAADVHATTEGVQRLYEIDWHQDAAVAAMAARDSAEDVTNDKPIVWFRVLGDLSGYM